MYSNKQEQLVGELMQNGGVVRLAGDGRCDSPGHCALYGTYTLMDAENAKVLCFSLVKVRIFGWVLYLLSTAKRDRTNVW